MVPTQIGFAQSDPAPAPGSTPEFWADSARREIDIAYSMADLERLIGAQILLDRALTRWPDDGLLLHYQGFALYREAMLSQSGVGEGDFGALMERAQGILERSAKIAPVPETKALISSIIGHQISLSPLRAMRLGPRADRWLSEAIEADPENPRSWLVSGIGLIFKPKLFGGGFERAEVDLRRAIDLFADDDPSPPLPSWGEGEAWLWLGRILDHQGRVDEAREAYLRVLELEPENAWAKKLLSPEQSTRG